MDRLGLRERCYTPAPTAPPGRPTAHVACISSPCLLNSIPLAKDHALSNDGLNFMQWIALSEKNVANDDTLENRRWGAR